ncbi:aminopeptidase N isoform X2 [Drosophila grimshawi]|uniref:aminopeptidase N isoform X2 n=1 Tax=Drosophila grimshawi TaxID=7222 RepID=UPI000C86E4B7|nr:aminopeptidase N isoform X2 [Drosophila grimshawi]
MRCFLLFSVLLATFCNASYDYYRLPSAVRPQHYNLRIMTHLEEASRQFFTGDVEIQIHVLQSTGNITLHAGAHLNIVKNGTRLKRIKPDCHELIDIRDIERNFRNDFYILHLDADLQRGQRFLLRLQFWGRLGRSMTGYYASSYEDNCSKKFMSVTQFEPADARSAFPCFDEPALKATFNITLGHHSKYNALSNMPINQKIPICERKNWVWSIFKQTELMSTYLVAYSINDFKGYASRTKKYQLSFTTWSRSSAIKQCRYAAEIGPRILSYFEDMFDIEYPLPKMDLLAVPDFNAGAMENWGLITFREASLFYDETDSSDLDRQHVANIIAHEVAHQWFGNLVTMEWWNDLWLNEGFATYMATLVMEKICRKWHAYEEESLDNVLAVLNTDGYCNTRPIHQAVNRASQITELFDAITYRKGAVIIRMMHMLIGDVAFRRGLNCYLVKHAFGNARQEDLWHALTEAAHQCGSIVEDVDVQTMMDTWTLQKGIPLINVQRQYDMRTATITQRRYLIQIANLDQPATDESCWLVPISYATDCLSNFVATESRAFLRCTEQHEALPLKLQDLPGENEWLILNVQVATPYRVNYDITNWELIIKSLLSKDFKRIHVMNRAQLIDDSMAFAWSGLLPYEMAVELLSYLRHEPDYMPWRAALDQLNAIYRIVRQTKQFPEFQYLLEPIYGQLGGMHKDTEGHHHVAHKALITKWACRLKQEDCVEHALRYYHRWLICDEPDETNPVPQNLRSVVYCTAIRHGDDEDWNFLWQRYRNTGVASEQRQILLALGCSHKVSLLERYLNIIYHEKSFIRKQDASQIFGAIVRNHVGFHITKDFFLHKFKLLNAYYHSNTRELVGMFIQIAQQTSCAMGYRQLMVFINTHQELQQRSGRSLRRALEQVKLNMRWRQKQMEEFVCILGKRN